MDNNNKKLQNSGIRVPQRNVGSLGLTQQQAAVNYRQQRVEQVYKNIEKKHLTYQTTQTSPQKITPESHINQETNTQNRDSLISNAINQVSKIPTQKPQADFKTNIGTPTEPLVKSSTQKVIQPIQSEQNHTQPIGAVAYKPQQAVRNSHAQPEKDQTGEQWKKYHAAWQNYYQKYYESYYTAALKQNSRLAANIQPEVTEELTESQKKERALAKIRQDIAAKARERGEKIRKSRHFAPIFSAIVVVFLFLFLQYNRLIFASVEAYVSPGNSSAEQTVYSPNSTTSVSQDPKLIIPKINVDVPVVYGVGSDGASQMKAMERGVAHFSIPGANAVPGQYGNTVLSGHSSNDLFDGGDYKFIFAQLDKLKEGDVIYANYNGVRYTYNIVRTEVVLPSEVSKVQTGTDKPMLTLITCTPLGTAEKRLLVFAEQVSPDPAAAKPAESSSESSASSVELPRNSKTFFERLFSWDWS